MLLEITSATWIVTGLGFGIVLALLFCLVFILQFFGWTMQKMTAPKAPQAPKEVKKENDDIAAIAMALYLASEEKHDRPTAMIYAQARETAWNEKAIGLNNVGF